MKGAALDPASATEGAAARTPRRNGRAHTRGAEIPELLTKLAALEVPAALRQLEVSDLGLSAPEVARRREQWGENRIAHERREPLALQVLKRLANPLNLLLLVLAAMSMGMGDRRAALIIFVMVVLSLTLATIQERRSSRAAERLRAMVHTTSTVIRAAVEGTAGPAQTVEIPIEELVPGDIVHLSAGDMVPADLRLIAAKDLFVNQASLTGESLPVEKYATPAGEGAATGIGAMSNICFMGTTVVSGSATGVIALTGRRAYFGGLAETIAGERVPTSFDGGVNRFAWLMIRFIFVMAPLVFLSLIHI